MIDFPNLNFPPYKFTLKKNEDGKPFIWDQIRKNYIQLTPEEWVRQHFILFFIQDLHYPKGLICVEKQHHYFKMKKRTDIMIRNRNDSWFMLLECKSPKVKINQSTLHQVSQYNAVINAQYIALSNGIQHFIWEKVHSEYRQLKNFPSFDSTK